MGLLIKADGSETTVSPRQERRGFTLDELYELIGCSTVQAIQLRNGCTLWMDEEGKFAEIQVVNERGTALLHEAGGMPDDCIVGTVLVTLPGEVK